MGRARGSMIMSEVISAMSHVIDVKVREKVYLILIPVFEDQDCDTLDECIGEDIAFDAALKNHDPDYFWFEEEVNET